MNRATNSKWKRFTAAVIIAVLAVCLPVLSMPAWATASNTLSISVQKQTAPTSETGDLVVEMQYSGESIGALQGALNYDKNQVRYVGIEGASSDSGVYTCTANPNVSGDSGILNFVWVDSGSYTPSATPILKFYFAFVGDEVSTTFQIGQSSIQACKASSLEGGSLVISDVTVESPAPSASYTMPKITITAQPQDATAASGDVSFTVSAAAEGGSLTYAWQSSSDNGTTWADYAGTGYNTDTMTLTASSERDGNLVRCKLTCGSVVVYSNTAAFHYPPPASITITSQPADVTGGGGTVNFTVGATATGGTLTYAWQYSINGGTTWVNYKSTGYNTSTMTLGAYASFDNIQVRCKLINGTITEYSDVATFHYAAPASIAITSQPADVTGGGGTVNFTVGATATGGTLTYAWQYSINGGTTWVNYKSTGYNTSTMTLGAYASFDNIQVRCKLINGTITEYSDVATFHYAAPASIAITSQPADVTGGGGTVNFTVGATATGGTLTYAWQYSINGGTTWVNYKSTGYNTSTMTLGAYASFDNIQVRCKLINGTVTKYSDVATFHYVAPASITITSQPTDASGNSGTVNFTVGATATGGTLTYAWQYSINGGTTWVNYKSTGYNTSTMTLGAYASFDNIQVRCKLINGTVTKYSDVATFHYVAPASITITSQPTDASGSSGTVNFTVGATATGGTLTYAWQYSINGGTTWVNYKSTGYNTSTMTLGAYASFDNIQVRCKMISGTVTKYSDVATFHYVAPASITITSQPTDASGNSGTVNFTVGATATGGTLTYAWQYSINGGTTWVNYKSTGYNTSTMTLGAYASFDNIQVRCKLISGTVTKYSDVAVFHYAA